MLEIIGVIAIIILFCVIAVAACAVLMLGGFTDDRGVILIGLGLAVIDILMLWFAVGDRIVLFFTG